MLVTTFEGEDFPHRLIWAIVKDHAELVSQREQDWSNSALVAMVFAFHTVEAYLNFVGERLAPDIWSDERNFFRKEPYRGWDGKLRKVMEIVGLPTMPNDRPLKTVLELKELRDLIVHGRPERLTGKIQHAEGTESPYPPFTLRDRFMPKEKLRNAVRDVEQFIEQIHGLAASKVNEDDIWFGAEALRGPLNYSVGNTALTREAV